MRKINQNKNEFEYHIETSRPYSDSEFDEMFPHKVAAVLGYWAEAGWEKAVDAITGETIEPDVTICYEGRKVNVYLQRNLEKKATRGR